MPWLCYIVTIPDIWVAMKFTEWHIVRVHLVQWSTNLLELHNAWYMPVFQLSPFSFFVFNTFCFTIATFILGPIYLIVLWSGDFLGEGTSTWFVIYALFDEVFKWYINENRNNFFNLSKLYWNWNVTVFITTHQTTAIQKVLI